MWRSGMRRRVAAALLLLAAAVVWAYAFLQTRTLLDAYPGVSVRMADAKVTAEQLGDILPSDADDGLTLTAAWTWGTPAAAAAESLKTAATLRVAAVWGDMRRTEPMTLMSGSLPAEEDWDGCLLDAQSAQALFRSVDPVGAKLTVNGRVYTVRGVAKTYTPVLFVRSADATYENLEFAVRDVSTGQADVKAFLYRHALAADYAVVQSGLYARILRGLVWLPVSLLLFAAAVRTLRYALPRRGRRLPVLLLLLLSAALLAAAGGLLVWNTAYWPQAFLPTKAADFRFWRTLADGWRAAWKALCLTAPLPGDILFFRGMRASLCSTAAAAALLAALWALTSRRMEENGTGG